MQSLRRLSVASIAPVILLLCSVSVLAQTAAAAPAKPALPQNAAPFANQIPPLFLPPLFPSGKASAPPIVEFSPDLRIPPLSAGEIQKLKASPAQNLALNRGPCYTLRIYGFTTGHDPAAAPRLTTSTTCAPASGTHVKELVNTPSNR